MNTRKLFVLIALSLSLAPTLTAQETVVAAAPVSSGGGGGGIAQTAPAFPEKLPIGSFQMLKSWASERVSHGYVGFWAEDASGKLNETSVEFDFPRGASEEVISAALAEATKKVKLNVSSTSETLRVSAYAALRDDDWNWTFRTQNVEMLVANNGSVVVQVAFKWKLEDCINLNIPGAQYAYLRIRDANGRIIDTRSIGDGGDGSFCFPSALAGNADLVTGASYKQNGNWVSERRIYAVNGELLPVEPVKTEATAAFKNVISLPDNAQEIAPTTDGRNINPYTLFRVRYTAATQVSFKGLLWTDGAVASSGVLIRRIGSDAGWEEFDAPESGTVDPGEYHFFYDLNPADFPPNDEVDLPPQHWGEGKS